jgi:hypothetical protein
MVDMFGEGGIILGFLRDQLLEWARRFYNIRTLSVSRRAWDAAALASSRSSAAP